MNFKQKNYSFRLCVRTVTGTYTFLPDTESLNFNNTFYNHKQHKHQNDH